MTAKTIDRATVATSPIENAVLALVIEHPGHTYQLWKRFDDRFGELMPVLTSRIYKAVTALTEAGLVEPYAEEALGPRSRNRGPSVRATPAGAQAHRSWLTAEFEDDPFRAELHRRVLATTTASVSALHGVVAGYERSCMSQMEDLKTAPESPANGSPEEILAALQQQLFAEERRLILDARLRWVAYARRKIAMATQEIAHARDGS